MIYEKTYKDIAGPPLSFTIQIAQANPLFHYGEVTYTLFLDTITSYPKDSSAFTLPFFSWENRLKTVTIGSLSHLALAIYNLFKAVFIELPKSTHQDDFRPFLLTLYTVYRDLEAMVGSLVAVFAPHYSLYLLQKAEFQKKCYRLTLSSPGPFPLPGGKGSITRLSPLSSLLELSDPEDQNAFLAHYKLEKSEQERRSFFQNLSFSRYNPAFLENTSLETLLTTPSLQDTLGSRDYPFSISLGGLVKAPSSYPYADLLAHIQRNPYPPLPPVPNYWGAVTLTQLCKYSGEELEKEGLVEFLRTIPYADLPLVISWIPEEKITNLLQIPLSHHLEKPFIQSLFLSLFHTKDPAKNQNRFSSLSPDNLFLFSSIPLNTLLSLASQEQLSQIVSQKPFLSLLEGRTKDLLQKVYFDKPLWHYLSLPSLFFLFEKTKDPSFLSYFPPQFLLEQIEKNHPLSPFLLLYLQKTLPPFLLTQIFTLPPSLSSSLLPSVFHYASETGVNQNTITFFSSLLLTEDGPFLSSFFQNPKNTPFLSYLHNDLLLSLLVKNPSLLSFLSIQKLQEIEPTALQNEPLATPFLQVKFSLCKTEEEKKAFFQILPPLYLPSFLTLDTLRFVSLEQLSSLLSTQNALFTSLLPYISSSFLHQILSKNPDTLLDRSFVTYLSKHRQDCPQLLSKAISFFLKKEQDLSLFLKNISSLHKDPCHLSTVYLPLFMKEYPEDSFWIPYLQKEHIQQLNFSTFTDHQISIVFPLLVQNKKSIFLSQQQKDALSIRVTKAEWEQLEPPSFSFFSFLP